MRTVQNQRTLLRSPDVVFLFSLIIATHDADRPSCTACTYWDEQQRPPGLLIVTCHHSMFRNLLEHRFESVVVRSRSLPLVATFSRRIKAGASDVSPPVYGQFHSANIIPACCQPRTLPYQRVISLLCIATAYQCRTGCAHLCHPWRRRDLAR